MSSYITSPKTGRIIKVGGETYQKLLNTKRYAKSVMDATHIKSGKKSKTKGWKDAAPKRGIERRELKERCGDKCFLQPSSDGFPICASVKKDKNCKIDCRGISSAYVRARQWDYPQVASKAKRLERKYC